MSFAIEFVEFIPKSRVLNHFKDIIVKRKSTLLFPFVFIHFFDSLTNIMAKEVKVNSNP